ncbi:ELL-associated factor 1 [Lingula anatina]|uniref:ELL-associated factor 1 n=1 Tax=Lingula anatina TaxID=7574 RepID=A0A1S3IY05_LINAN|nr:ELL-associated factor 1 [Lingula anatina]|eukprot:XP_013402429.1 ELL-associated factor 1 [Lingula anatina]
MPEEKIIPMDSEPHELKLGKSFDHHSRSAFHSIRYDFKPASVDTSKVASVDVQPNKQVIVTVPHVEGAGTTQTVYKGNKRPCQKECVLIIDHRTGEITLEKLSSTVQLKKTRTEGSSRAQTGGRPVTPNEQLKLKTSPSKKKHSSHSSSSHSLGNSQENVGKESHSVASPGVMSDMDSSSSSSSDDSDTESKPTKTTSYQANGGSHHIPPSHSQPHSQQYQSQSGSKGYVHSTLSEDLQLSDSESDSD